MNILLLDIETAPTVAYTWSLWPKYIPHDNVVQNGHTLCWAAKWAGKKEVMYADIRGGEQKMLNTIHGLLEEADAVVHYNGTKFDIPTLNREFVRHGMAPPAHYHQIDLLKTVRKQFKFESNKLDAICMRLGLGGKVKHKGMSLWIGCMEGRDSDWRIMQRYNRRDVRILERLYKYLLPWIHNHPTGGLWLDDPKHPVCYCGGRAVKKGTQYNSKTSSYDRYKCTKCGAPLRSRLQSKRTSENVLVRT